MEFLSSQFDAQNNSFPVNLVLQSPQSVAQGYNAQGTGNYKVENLPFDPTKDFHEYRIDFTPRKVIFFADGEILAMMDTPAVPTSPGHMILIQWSNGDPKWSFGPPLEDATMLVSYVKAYFNSSDRSRQESHATRCKDLATPGALCPIPEYPGAPPESFGNLTESESYFFTDQPNMAEGQIHFDKNEGVRDVSSALSLFLLSLSSISSIFAVLL